MREIEGLLYEDGCITVEGQRYVPEAEAERLREALRDVERCADGNASPERLRRIVADALAPAPTGKEQPDG